MVLPGRIGVLRHRHHLEHEDTMTRHVVMFSSGAGSAMAAMRVAETLPEGDQLTLLFADVGEHPDNYRFLHEAHERIGGELVILTNDGRTIWDVFTQGRFLGNSRVDLCSRVLKREPMRKWLEANCSPESTIVYLGFDWTEEHRMERARPHWEPWDVRAPLCDEPLIDKKQAMDEMEASGLLPPLLTRQGFPHANCGGGCVKAGHGQFKRLLELDPATFATWERKEQEFRDFIGKDVSILKDRIGGPTKPLTLRALRERLGVDPHEFDDEEVGGCNCMTPLEEDRSVGGDVPVSISTRVEVRPVSRKTQSKEWMMGLDEGWVTGVDGLKRGPQLKALGNGVVPQQAEAALMYLLEGRADLLTTTEAPTTTPHPAKFSPPVLETIQRVLVAHRFMGVVLDPFAGVGGIHDLANDGVVTVGVELEPEWAGQHPMTICGSALNLGALGFEDGEVDAIVTSPAYGNRMADHHTPSPSDTSKRHTYRHYLGRELTDGSSGVMQWGDGYRDFHREAWREATRVLRFGGLFVLNISDHVRKGKVMPVSAWHRATLSGMGVDWLPGGEGKIAVATRRQRHGTNGELRVLNEWVMVGVKRGGAGS